MNPMKRTLSIAVLLIAVFFIHSGCAGRVNVPGSEEDGDRFYQMTRHLMTSHELRAYKRLASPEARTRFIAYFWEIRDPNPMTEENEFRRMILDRFEHVQRYFNEGQRPGWRTDRGWIYMILGPPEQEDLNARIDDSSRNKGRAIFWYYGFTGATGLRIPGGGFRLLFWDQKGYGEYRLHQPSLPLRVLDIMEELKYNMIVNREGDFPGGEGIDFSVRHDGESRKLWITFGPKNVSIERTEGKALVRFHVDVLVFSAGQNIDKFSRDWEQRLDESRLLEDDFNFRIPMDVQMAPGKKSLDVIVTDLLSGRKSRRMVNVKIAGK